ncbi:MAG: HTH domain-containing protein [bacterium]|nr:HTH domain-containing protein [bacterium]
MPPEETKDPNAQEPTPEPPSSPAEAPVPETEPSAPPPASAEASAGKQAAPEAKAAPESTPAEPPTAHIPTNEPLPPESEPFDFAQDKPIPPASAESPDAPPPEPKLPRRSASAARFARNLLVKARAATQTRKQKKLEKIMLLLNTKPKITNDEVEKLLHVSDATATRYLAQLEKEGKITQVGRTGAGVTYTRI